MTSSEREVTKRLWSNNVHVYDGVESGHGVRSEVDIDVDTGISYTSDSHADGVPCVVDATSVGRLRAANHKSIGRGSTGNRVDEGLNVRHGHVGVGDEGKISVDLEGVLLVSGGVRPGNSETNRVSASGAEAVTVDNVDVTSVVHLLLHEAAGGDDTVNIKLVARVGNTDTDLSGNDDAVGWGSNIGIRTERGVAGHTKTSSRGGSTNTDKTSVLNDEGSARLLVNEGSHSLRPSLGDNKGRTSASVGHSELLGVGGGRVNSGELANDVDVGGSDSAIGGDVAASVDLVNVRENVVVE